MDIRLKSFEDSPDIAICEYIKVSGIEADIDDTWEYRLPLTIWCAGHNTYHEVWVLVN